MRRDGDGRMKKRALKVCFHCLEGLAVFIGVAAGLGVLAAWLLFSGPVSLDVIKPNVQSALKQSLPPGYRIEFGQSYLVWDEEDAAIHLNARDVEVFDASNTRALSAPQLDIEFSLIALGRRLLAPVEIEMHGVDAVIVRESRSEFRIGFSGDERRTPSGDASQTDSTDLLETLLDAPDGSRADGYLRRITLTGGSADIIDQVHGREWRMPEATLDLERRGSDVAGQLDALLRWRNRSGRVRLDVAYSDLSDTARVDIRIEDAPFAEILGELPVDGAPDVDAPLSGRLSATFSGEGRLLAADADLSLGAGVMAEDDLGDAEPFEIAGGVLRCAYVPDDHILQVDRFEFDAGENRGVFSGALQFESALWRRIASEQIGFSISSDGFQAVAPGVLADTLVFSSLQSEGTLDLEAGRLELDRIYFEYDQSKVSGAGQIVKAYTPDGRLSPEVTMTARVEGQVSPKNVVAFWPLSFGAGGRDWIRDNLIDARIFNVDAEINLQPGALEIGHVPDSQMRVTFDFEDAHANYVSGLTHLTEAKGSAVLTGNRFTLEATGGRAGDIRLIKGDLDITALNKKGSEAFYRGLVEGRTADILGLLNMQPFRFADKFGLDPEPLGGEGVARFEIMRPMRREVRLESIGFNADAKVEGFSMPAAARGLAIEDGAFELSLDEKGIIASGAAKLGGVKSDLVWTETFNAPGGLSTAFEVSGVLTDEDRAALKLPGKDLARGPVEFQATTLGSGFDIKKVEASANLAGAELDLGVLSWLKPAGDDANVLVKMDFQEDGGILLNAIQALGDGVNIVGEARVTATGGLMSASFPRFEIADAAEVSLFIDPLDEGGGLDIRLSGEALDASGLLEKLQAGSDDDSPFSGALKVDAQVNRLRLLQDEVVAGAKLSLDFGDERIREAQFTGRMGEEKRVALKIAPSMNDGADRRLSIRAADAGAFVRGLFGSDYIEGGELVVTADVFDPPGPTNEAEAEEGLSDTDAQAPKKAPSYEGSVQTTGFRIVNAPLMARVLSAGSFSGVSDLLNGEGIAFERFNSAFSLREGVLGLDDLVATGPSVGFTAEGPIDFKDKKIRMKGAVAPAYALNSAIGAMPIVGEVLVRREGEGLFALSYGVNGELDAPQVTVNPLSAFTPGALRGLFELQATTNNAKRDGPPPR